MFANITEEVATKRRLFFVEAKYPRRRYALRTCVGTTTVMIHLNVFTGHAEAVLEAEPRRRNFQR